jgi:hypothetical protein
MILICVLIENKKEKTKIPYQKVKFFNSGDILIKLIFLKKLFTKNPNLVSCKNLLFLFEFSIKNSMIILNRLIYDLITHLRMEELGWMIVYLEMQWESLLQA